MKNAAIIRALPDHKSLRHEHEALKRQIKSLLKQEQQLQREVDTLDRVTEVFEGVALSVDERPTIYGRDLDVHAVGDDIDRWADVYANAHNNGADYGLRFRFRRANGMSPAEDWQGTGWAWKDACLMARQFVAHGTVPAKALQDMLKLRHALDPDDTVPKRRRLAFEAAYEAGHVELAKELLLGKAKLDKRLAQLARARAKADCIKDQVNA